jgi:hypothetical protein
MMTAAARSAPSPAVAPWCPYVGAGLAELLHVLMLHYTGYPELYSPLLTALPQAPLPSLGPPCPSTPPQPTHHPMMVAAAAML